MNVLSYSIVADARKFVVATMQARRAVQVLKADVESVRASNAAGAAGGAAGGVDYFGNPIIRQMNAAKATAGRMGSGTGPIADSAKDLERTSARGIRDMGKLVMGAFAAVTVFKLGMDLGRAVHDFFQRIGDEIRAAQTRAFRSSQFGRMERGGMVERDIGRATRGDRERRGIENAEGMEQIRLIEESARRKSKELENLTRSAGELLSKVGPDDSVYKDRIQEIRKLENEIAELQQKSEDAYDKMRKRQNDSRMDFTGAERDAAEYELSKKPLADQRAAIEARLRQVNSPIMETPENIRERTDLRRRLDQINKAIAEDEGRASEERLRIAKQGLDAMVDAARERERAMAEADARAERAAGARDDLRMTRRATAEATSLEQMAADDALRKIGAYRSPLEENSEEQVRLLKVIADNSQGPRKGGR